MNIQQMDMINGGGRGGRGGVGGGYGSPGGRGYQVRASMSDYGGQGQQQYGGQQVYNPQAYGGPRGPVSPLGGGYGGVRYPVGYGGAAAVSGMGRSAPGAGGYSTTQMYSQQTQPIGYYGYGYRFAVAASSWRADHASFLSFDVIDTAPV